MNQKNNLRFLRASRSASRFNFRKSSLIFWKCGLKSAPFCTQCLWIRQNIKQHNQEHGRIACQNTYMPDLMAAKMGRKWIWFPNRKNECADSVEESAREEQGAGFHSKLVINGTDQKNDDPPHQQIADIWHPDRNPFKENGFDRNEKDSQTPNDPK